MNRSLLNTVPHLPVPIDTDQRNPLPSYHVTTSLEQKRVPLRTQQVAACSTGVSPVMLKSIPTRPIEVQPLSAVPSPRGPRLPQFVPPKKRVSTVGKWGRIQIATQEPPALIHEDAQIAFEMGHAQNMLEVEDGAPVEDAHFTCKIGHEQIAFEMGHAQSTLEVEDGASVEDAHFAFEIGHEQGPIEDSHAQGTFEPERGSDTVLLKERVSLPMQRVPLMSVQPLHVATGSVRTQTVAVRRNKKSRRPKKPTSARIW